MRFITTNGVMTPWVRQLVGASALALLGGCASLSADGGFGPVQQAVKERLNQDVEWQRDEAQRGAAAQRVAQLLAEPLQPDQAVQVALLNNRGLQASFYDLGISEADLVVAGRLPNPGFSFGRLTRGDEVEFDRGFHFNLARLLTFSLAQEVEQRRFDETRRQVTQNVLGLAAQVRKAYFLAVAAEQTVRYMRQVQDAAEAGSELAKRMAQAGNWSKLQQAREHSFYADAALNLARAQQAQVASHEALSRLLGLDPQQGDFRLPDRLPDLPASPDELPQVEQSAMDQRLDVQAAKLRTAQLASNLGLSRATRFINVLELGVVRNSSNEQGPQRGYEISLELPLFDWGQARTAKAQALYMQSVHQTAQTAIEARSEVRQAYQAYRSSFEVARQYRDEIVPLKKRISDEVLLQYNGMLIGVFDLLADARSQIDSVNGSIQAQRDFWIAKADLDMALSGKAALTSPDASTAMPAATTSGQHP